MSIVATRLLDELQKLAPQEQVEVRDRLISLTQAQQRGALARLRGATKGKGLLGKLLTERAKERIRG